MLQSVLTSSNESIFLHQVQDEEISCPFCSKKCKSVGGLKRHVTCKHKDERENGPETDEGEESEFTNELLAKMVEEVKRRLINNKVFPGQGHQRRAQCLSIHKLIRRIDGIR